MNPFSLCLSLCLAAGAALPGLACPGPENMEKGVIFRTEDGVVETHSRFSEDWVVIRMEFSDSEGSLLEARHGLYLHSSTPIENGVIRLGQKEVFSGRGDLAAWKAPKPDATWRNDTSTGGAATAGPMREIAVGGCRFKGFEVTLTFKDDPTYTELYHYLPELGVGLLVASSTDGSTDSYVYTEAQAVE